MRISVGEHHQVADEKLSFRRQQLDALQTDQDERAGLGEML